MYLLSAYWVEVFCRERMRVENVGVALAWVILIRMCSAPIRLVASPVFLVQRLGPRPRQATPSAAADYACPAVTLVWPWPFGLPGMGGVCMEVHGDKALVEFLSDDFKEEKRVQMHKSLPRLLEVGSRKCMGQKPN